MLEVNGVSKSYGSLVAVSDVSFRVDRGETIGLLGPTRMNYPLALAAARVVGDRLGQRLSDAGR